MSSKKSIPPIDDDARYQFIIEILKALSIMIAAIETHWLRRDKSRSLLWRRRFENMTAEDARKLRDALTEKLRDAGS